MVIRTASIPRVAALHTFESMRGVDPAEVPNRGYLGQFRIVKRSNVMRAVLATLLLLAASPLLADCIANGHYSLASSAFPYTEDLTRPTSQPLHDGMWVADGNDWTLVQTACSERTNVNASVDVTRLVRASFHVGKTTAAPDAIFDVQLRVDGEPLVTQSRRVGDQFPKSFRFGTSVERLEAGNHLLTMWVRMRNPGAIYVGLQWITAQGVPANNGSHRVLADSVKLGSEWTAIGSPLPVKSIRDIDAALQASFTVASAVMPLSFDWTVDDEKPGARPGVVAAPLVQPDGVMVFDHRGWIDRGSHTVQLWGRSDATAELKEIAIDAVGFPHETPAKVTPLIEASADATIVATTAGDPQQPLAMCRTAAAGRRSSSSTCRAIGRTSPGRSTATWSSSATTSAGTAWSGSRSTPATRRPTSECSSSRPTSSTRASTSMATAASGRREKRRTSRSGSGESKAAASLRSAARSSSGNGGWP